MTDEDDATFYRDPDGQWRWAIQAAGNHETVAASTESYVHKQDMLRNFTRATGRQVPADWEESLG